MTEKRNDTISIKTSGRVNGKITDMTVTQLSTLLQGKELSSVEVVESYLEKIETKEPDIQAYITITSDTARKQAAVVDQMRLAGQELPPLAGIPAAFKDNICTRGIRPT